MEPEAPGSAPNPLPVLPPLVFLLVALLLLGVALPRVRSIQARDIASEAFRDVSVLRSAASAYLLAHGDWPPGISAAEGPGPLAPYLPSGFSFRKERYEVSWKHWPLPGGLPPGGDSVSVVGVSLRTPSAAVSSGVVRALGAGIGRFTVGETTTIILEGL